MRVIVCGGRTYSNLRSIADELSSLPMGTTLVTGGAAGADHYAEGWWLIHKRGRSELHRADWDKHGKAAGPIRNQEMLDSGVDLVIAFPGGKGTTDMVKRAKKAGVEVREVKP